VEDYDDIHDAGSPVPAWPPWVTGRTPAGKEDITLEEEKSTQTPPNFTAGSVNLHPAYYISLVYYTLPVIVIQIGRLVQQ